MQVSKFLYGNEHTRTKQYTNRVIAGNRVMALAFSSPGPAQPGPDGGSQHRGRVQLADLRRSGGAAGQRQAAGQPGIPHQKP